MTIEKEFVATLFIICLILSATTVIFYARTQDAKDEVAALQGKLRAIEQSIKNINEGLNGAE